MFLSDRDGFHDAQSQYSPFTKLGRYWDRVLESSFSIGKQESSGKSAKKGSPVADKLESTPSRKGKAGSAGVSSNRPDSGKLESSGKSANKGSPAADKLESTPSRKGKVGQSGASSKELGSASGKGAESTGSGKSASTGKASGKAARSSKDIGSSSKKTSPPGKSGLKRRRRLS